MQSCDPPSCKVVIAAYHRCVVLVAHFTPALRSVASCRQYMFRQLRLTWFSNGAARAHSGSTAALALTLPTLVWLQDTGDTRETPAIDVCKGLIGDGAQLNIYDPQVLPHLSPHSRVVPSGPCGGDQYLRRVRPRQSYFLAIFFDNILT